MMRVGKKRVWHAALALATVCAVCVASVAFIWQRQMAHAAGLYPSGAQGYDISWPQCGGAYPATPYAFGIVGVTDGRAFTLNPCRASEYAWAQSASGAGPLALYMNLNYPVGSTATQGQSGPYGSCKKNSACYAENYGWNAARYAFTQNGSSAPLTASVWWLDIETGNSWSSATSLNADVIQGALAYLGGQGVTAGVYSTPSQWKTIAGVYAPNVPNWSAGALASNPGALCSVPLYTGGVVWLTQYSSGGFDANYSC